MKELLEQTYSTTKARASDTGKSTLRSKRSNRFNLASTVF